MADWVYEMPAVTSARQFTSQFLPQAEAVSLFNQINGIWARVSGDHIDFGLSAMVMMTLDMVGPENREPGDPMVGDWIPNPFGDELLEEALSVLRAADVEESTGNVR